MFIPDTLKRGVLALLFAAVALQAWAANPVPAEHKLANGMRVIVKPDHRAPVVVSMVWYRVGSMDEHNGTTGVAHVLEHMLFKGTKEVPAGEFSRLIAAAGGRDNAFTNQDYTAYFQTLHKSRLELALRLEADRMVNALIDPAEFAKEIRVVMEERRLRTDDQPRALVFEQLLATAYRAHPYRHPVIGWMNDLENMTAQDARDFYERWYAPNNAILVVVGDVQPAEVFKLAEKYFGSLSARQLPERKPQEEPAQRGLQRIVVKAPAEQSFIAMAYRAPVLRNPQQDWEPYAMEMLANVLDANEAARLNASIVRKQRVAGAVDVHYDGINRGPALLFITAEPAEGHTVPEVEAALRRELQLVIDQGVTEEELKRVKAQVIAAHVFQRDSMFFQARQIGMFETAGLPYTTVDLLLEKLKGVTAQQIQEVARKYLVDDALTIAVLDPQPLAERRAPAATPGVRHDR